MDTRFLESLITVVETGSIANGARSQGLTATAVSQRIRTLENNLGVELLLRDAHSARPTDACLNLLPHARKIVLETKALKANVDATGLAGHLRLGAISTALTDLIPGVVKHIAEQAPNADLTITPGTSTNLYNMLIQEELDAAILVQPYFQIPKKICSQSIVKQELVVISAMQDSQSVQSLLKNNKLILYDRNSYGGRIAWDWVMNQKQPTDILCELDSLETIAIMVDQGLGVAVVPFYEGLTRQHPQLSVRPVKHSSKYCREIVLLWRHLTHAQKLVDLVKSSF